ncbi:MAG: FmdB family zinc ribbon protein [Candidatus Binatia bacterium]
MPIYEFCCETCGPFECWRPMRESNYPMLCSACHEAARRIFSPPGLLLTAHSSRRRQERAVEPRIVQRAPKAAPAAVRTSRRQTGGRPWQLSH